jgi:enamine deaminase RidA (YjgF/YER057c/UK114 family)
MSVAPQPHTLTDPSPLTFRRLGAGEAAASPLGGRWVGEHAQALHTALLAPEGARLDAWFGAAAVKEHRYGCVHYVTDGQWLYGSAMLDEAAAGGMQAAAQRAYADLFAVLAASPTPHLLRLWNYFADINLETDGTERYRQFNAGRQQAFIDAQRSAFDGSPAACALGVHGGPLRVSFLAGRHAPLAIENPRQVSAYRYPDTYGPRAPTFSRAAMAEVGDGRVALFISGTASIVGHATLHAGDVRRQTEESLTNIAAVREAAGKLTGIVFDAAQMVYTVYVRHPGDLPVIREVFERHVGADSPAAREAVYLHADICRADLLVEIEAHGFAASGGAA